MLEKGFIRKQKNENNRQHQIALLISNVLLILGVIILILTFGYLIFNFDQSETLIGILVPFLFAGLGLVLVSQLIKRAYTKLRR